MSIGFIQLTAPTGATLYIEHRAITSIYQPPEHAPGTQRNPIDCTVVTLNTREVYSVTESPNEIFAKMQKVSEDIERINRGIWEPPVEVRYDPTPGNIRNGV